MVPGGEVRLELRLWRDERQHPRAVRAGGARSQTRGRGSAGASCHKRQRRQRCAASGGWPGMPPVDRVRDYFGSFGPGKGALSRSPPGPAVEPLTVTGRHPGRRPGL